VRVFEEFGDTGFSTLTDSLGSVVDFLDGLKDSVPFLDTELPLINRSVSIPSFRSSTAASPT
jgi:hypothetical protein